MVKHLLQQPKTLESMAIVKVGDWIALQGKLFMSEHRDGTKTSLSRLIEIIRNRINKVPWVLHNTLAVETMRALDQLLLETYKLPLKSTDCKRKYDSQINVVGRLINTLFNENLTVLSPGSQCMKIVRASIYSKSYLLTGLIKLKLKYIPTDFIHTLKQLNSFINNISTIITLKRLAKNCKLIEELDLSGSVCLHDNNIVILTQFRNLKKVDLSGTGITQKGVKIMLMSCDNLEHILVDSEYIIAALEHVVSFEDVARKRFKIKSFSYRCSRRIKFKHLELLVQLFPLIETLKVYKHWPFDRHLMAFVNLQNLRELDFVGFDISSAQDRLKELLQVRGCNLVHLRLDTVDQIDLNSLRCISKMCPKLESLCIYHCTFVNQANTVFPSKVTVSEISPFRSLKRLTLDCCLSSPTVEQLLFLLSNCPSVEFIGILHNIYDKDLLTDDVMSIVLDQNPFSCLKELKIDYNQLSVLVIDRIIQNCNNLREVQIKQI